MKGFVLGILVTLVALVCGAFVVSAFGLYPIGADNPPGALERMLASRAMDVYADKHKPSGDNPVQITVASLSEGATEYEEHCAFCHGGAKARTSPMQGKFSPKCSHCGSESRPSPARSRSTLQSSTTRE
jgi:hypothetical protein